MVNADSEYKIGGCIGQPLLRVGNLIWALAAWNDRAIAATPDYGQEVDRLQRLFRSSVPWQEHPYPLWAYSHFQCGLLWLLVQFNSWRYATDWVL